MKRVILYSLIAFCFAACHSVRNAASLPQTTIVQQRVAGAISIPEMSLVPVSVTPEEPQHVTTGSFAFRKKRIAQQPFKVTTSVKAATTQINSFAQWKKMAADGNIAIRKKELKMVGKLDKKYKGNFEQFRADAFELTTKAKIIGAIGIVGLLLGLFISSPFGWFLFILSALAFLLRYLEVITF